MKPQELQEVWAVQQKTKMANIIICNFSISLGDGRSSCEFSYPNNLKTIGPKFAHTVLGPKHGKTLQISRVFYRLPRRVGQN